MSGRIQTVRPGFRCHPKAFVFMLAVILLNMCLLLTCDAEANPIPKPSADADALWDKLPALQKFNAAGKVLSLNPTKRFTSASQGS